MRGALRPPSSGPGCASWPSSGARCGQDGHASAVSAPLAPRVPSWPRGACRRGRGAGRRGALPAGERDARDEARHPSHPTQVGEVVRGVGKVSLDVYNFLLKINGKYDLTDKAGAQLKDQLNKLKAGSSGETIAKVEDALSKATSKFNELDKEYDLVEKGKQALGYAGDLSAKAIDKGLELNAEYKLTDQVVAKVTEASSAAAAKATKKSA